MESINHTRSLSSESRNDMQDGNDSSDNEQTNNIPDLIEQHHLELVTNIDLERQFLFSYLRSKGILDDEDCERIINTGTTRQQKASIFLDVIKRKGIDGMKHFVDALEYEHPELYKKITGNEAASKVSTVPYMMNTTWTGLAGKDFIDFDRMVLAKQLEQTVSDLHWVTRVHHKVQEEKNMLEKRLFEAEKNKRIQTEHIEELKQVIEKISDIKKITEESTGMSSNEVLAQAQCIELAAQRDLVRKTNLIIALQGKLLAQTEEIEHIKKENVGEKIKNDTLAKELMGLTVMFDAERRQSRRLNEQVQNHQGDKCKVDNGKVERDLKLKFACVNEENELMKTELEEFRKYSEVLNAKFNMVSQEKLELSEHNEVVSFSFQDAQDRINELYIQCASLKFDKDYLSKANERLMSDVITYREIQKTLQEEQERIRSDRDDAWKAMEKANDELLKSKRAHDEAIHSQMILNRTLEQKYFDICEELDVMRDCLTQTKEEVVMTKKLLGDESFLRRNSSCSINQPQSTCNSISSMNSMEVTEEMVDVNISEKPNFGMRRTNKELLDSIKRKVSESDDNVTSVPTSSYSTYSGLSYEQMLLVFSETNPKTYVTENSATVPRCRSPYRTKSPSESINHSISQSTSPTSPYLYSSKSHTLATSPTFMARENIIERKKATSEVSLMLKKTEHETKNGHAQRKFSCPGKDKNIQSKTALRKFSESGADKRDSFVRKKYASSEDSSVFDSVSSQPAHLSYVQSAIMQSQKLDYPPSFLHSTGFKKVRSGSTPNIIRKETLSSTDVFTRSSIFSEGSNEPIVDKRQKNNINFRERASCLVNAEQKSKWDRRRSVSAPPSPMNGELTEIYLKI